jgi:hypothetical protein
VNMKMRHQLEGDQRDVTIRPAVDVTAYEPPAIEDLGTLLQLTAGTGARRTQDPAGTSV